MSEHLIISRESTFVQITFHRLERKNALTLAMYTAMADELERINDDPAITSVIFAGDENIFTAGNDIMDFASGNALGSDAPVLRFLRSLFALKKMAIAVPCGAAVGIGTTMLLHCDFVFAGENASFSTPFSKLGLVPEAASSLLMPQRFGTQFANRMLLAGEKIKAVEAKEVGLVGWVLPAGEALDAARSYAEKLGELPPKALLQSKALLQMHQREQIQSAANTEAELFAKAMVGEEAVEAFTAFLEKRKPVFQR